MTCKVCGKRGGKVKTIDIFQVDYETHSDTKWDTFIPTQPICFECLGGSLKESLKKVGISLRVDRSADARQPSPKHTDLKFGAVSEKEPEKVIELKPRRRSQPTPADVKRTSKANPKA
jgi:hypothetical protein